MKKDDIIAVRTALKTEKNYPIKVFINNSWDAIDEGLFARYTEWNDDKELLTYVKQENIADARNLNNAGTRVRVFTVSYETIEAMCSDCYVERTIDPITKEAIPSMFEDVIDGMQEIAPKLYSIKDRFTDYIRGVFHPKRKSLTAADKKILIGYKEDDSGVATWPILYGVDEVDYYQQQWPELFKETRRYAERNKTIDEQNGG